MKILKIKLVNFQSYKNEEFQMNDVMVILRENGAGKSAFLKALNFALCGEGCDDGEIMQGEKEMSVSILFENGLTVERKTTTASAVAKESDLEKSVHMHTDDFYHYLSKGAIPPHLPESNEQNLIVIEAFLEAAKRYARGGYDVIVDGIIGPWFLKPWQSLVREHYEVHYIVLRASKEETLKRAVERSKLDRKTNIELVETMWEQFCNLGIYESNVIDTTTYSIQETVSAVQEKIASRAALLS